jgi:hypothetical protein
MQTAKEADRTFLGRVALILFLAGLLGYIPFIAANAVGSA